MERDNFLFSVRSIFKISTHTLTWSVTGVFFHTHQLNTNFNSHAHVERDDGTDTFVPSIVNFNSHAHVERDIKSDVKKSGQNNFNSHAHVERDHHLTETVHHS